MLVVYTNGHETLVCEDAGESVLIEDYFKSGGRDLEDYDRVSFSRAVQILSQTRINN